MHKSKNINFSMQEIHLYYSKAVMLQFWTNVKEELDYNLITQKDLARLVGISYNTLQSWITKDRLPDAEQALKIAKELKTSVEYLLTGKNESQSNINPLVQNLIPKLNHLSNENLDLLKILAEKLQPTQIYKASRGC